MQIEILNEILTSFDLLKREKGWDDEGAEPVNHRAYSRALELILWLSNRIENLECPWISLCPDGTIDLEFRNGKEFRLLINVTATRISLYGDNYKNDDIVNLAFDNIPNEDLLTWTKRNIVNK